jgi:hypothetical protein
MSAPVRCCLWLALAVASPLACSSNDDVQRSPPAAGTHGGGVSGSAGADAGAGAGGAQQSAGGAPTAEAGQGGAPGDLDLGGSLSIAGAPTYDPPLCDFEASWGNPVALAGVSTAQADERLLGMTHDALTLVFTRDDVLMIADRPSAEDDFGAAVAVTMPAGYAHTRGVALHPDGLGLVIVSELGDRLAEVTREARSGDFDAAVETARFEDLSENAVQYGGGLSSPVLSASGTSFYFTQLAGNASKVFHTQGTTAFAIPTMPEDLVTLGGEDGDFKLTLSVSADERTLFFFDEALGHAAGLWNSAPGAPFYDEAHFPGLDSVFSDADCSHLYGTSDSDGSLDVVLETPK